MDEINKTPEEINSIVDTFKKEFVTEGSIVLDAWWEHGIMKVHIDGLRMVDEDGNPNPELEKVPAPGEYQGLPTMLELFPREEQE